MENSSINGNAVIRSLSWKVLERAFTQGVNLFVQILLARIIAPECFGSLAIIVALTNFASVFVQSGLSTVIIQKENLKDVDVSTLLVASLAVALLLYVGLYIGSPFLANYYDMPDIIWPLRVLAIVLFLNAINSIQSAILMRGMDFKTLFYRSLIAIPLSGAIGIIMALKGYGLWALVAQVVSNMLIVVAVMSISVHIKNPFRFSFESFKGLFSFSGKIVLTSLVCSTGDMVRTMVIGKKYSSEQLAYYDKAYTYSNYATQIAIQSTMSVLLPTFSRSQDDSEKLKLMTRKSVSVTALVMIPLLIAIAVMSKTLVILLLTEKWIEAAPFLSLFCLLRIPGCILSIDKQTYYAIGNSTIAFYYEFIMLLANLGLLFYTVNIGLFAIAIGATVVEFLGLLAIFIISQKVISYSIRERIKDLYKPVVASLFMAIVIWTVPFFFSSIFVQVLIQFLLGIIVYYLASRILKNQDIDYLKNKLMTILPKVRR